MLLVAGGVALAAVVVYPYSRAAETNQNIALGRVWIVKVMPTLNKDDRFGRVQLLAMAADSGSLLCSGVVENEQELDQLRRLLLGSKPPLRIRWDVSTRVKSAAGPVSAM